MVLFNKELLTGTFPVNKELLTGTVPFNKSVLNLNTSHGWYQVDELENIRSFKITVSVHKKIYSLMFNLKSSDWKKLQITYFCCLNWGIIAVVLTPILFLSYSWESKGLKI